MTKHSYNIQGHNIVTEQLHAGDDLAFCIHGLGCCKRSFGHFEDFARTHNVSVCSIDLPGYGESDKPSKLSYSMEELAGACAEVIKQLSFKRLHIIGHSMGGAVGLLLPAQVLQSITSFSSIEGNLTGEDCGSASRRAASVSYEEFCSRILPEYKKNFAAYASLDSASPDAYYRSAHSLVTWSDSGEPLKRYRSLPCKKTYFYGDENKLHPTVQITSFAPQCEISASGSFPMVDNPGQFYPALIELMLQ